MLHRLNRRASGANFLSSVGSVPGKGALPAFDPLTFDVANLLELWDGDIVNYPTNWIGQHAGSVLTFGTLGASTITVVPGGLNGHDYVQFSQVGGTGFQGSYAKGALPNRAQPTTQYLVFKNDVHFGNRYVMDDGAITLRNAIRAVNPANNMLYTSIASGANFTNEPALGVFAVITIVKEAGANNTSQQINKTAKVIYTSGVLNNDQGLCLNSHTNQVAFTFLATGWAYIILRQGADSLADQIQFQDWLIARFGL